MPRRVPRQGVAGRRNRQTRVRRNHRTPIAAAAEPTHFFPLPIPGLIAWYDFGDRATLFQETARSTPVAVDTDPIGGVTDKSGGGKHLGQNTAGLRPLYKTAIQNGLGVGRADGSDDCLGTAAQVAASTVIIVAKNLTGGDGNGRLWGLNANAQAGVFDNASTWGYYCNEAVAVVALVDANTAFSVVSIVYTSAAAATGYVNGTSKASFDPGDAYAAGAAFFLFGSDAGGSNSIKADIAECLCFSGALNSVDRTAAERYLGAKWGVTVA